MQVVLQRLTGLCLLAMLIAVGLSACGVAPTRPSGPALESATVSAAQALVQKGDRQGAARIYLQAAQKAPAPQALEYRLRAADLLIKGGALDKADTVLAGLPPKTSEPTTTLRLQLLRARLALAEHRPQDALQALQSAPTEGQVPTEYNNRYYELRAQAFAMAGNHLESARERVWLDPMLPNADARLANETALWQQLSQLSDSALQQLSVGPPDVLSGWMALVRITRQLGQQPQALQQAIANWKQRYPNHPAQQQLLAKVLASLSKTRKPPKQIALLLPLTGPLAPAADAVRDGFMAAYYNQPAGVPRPVIRIYDTADNANNSWSLYQQAVAEGAQFVVGPLDKAAVAELAQSGTLSVPVLSLNYLDNDSDPPADLYQFGLSPEDEAVAAADRARQDGHDRAVALVPQGPWGQRVLAAFEHEWDRLGGTFVEAQTYDPDKTDYSSAITHLLNIDASRDRERALERLVGRVKFDPRRRQDVDFVFLVAQPRQARLMRPQLRFHHAGDLPVYATSHVYGGEPDQEADRDLDGIRFCDMPWTLEHDATWSGIHAELDRLWPQRTQRYARLYALGLDAYDVLPYLQELGQGGTLSRFNGATGNLYLDSKDRLHRELRWAQFRNGLPQLLPAPATPQGQQPPSGVAGPSAPASSAIPTSGDTGDSATPLPAGSTEGDGQQQNPAPQ